MLAEAHRNAKAALDTWQQQFEPPVTRLRERIIALFPALRPIQSNVEDFRRAAIIILREQRRHAVDRAARGRLDSKRRAEVSAQLTVAARIIETIDREIASIAENAGDLGAVLAELSTLVSDEICPVCDRDFAEEKKGPLAAHLNHKVRTLSGSAERLLGLSRNRGDLHLRVERLERESAELAASRLDPKLSLILIGTRLCWRRSASSRQAGRSLD